MRLTIQNTKEQTEASLYKYGFANQITIDGECNTNESLETLRNIANKLGQLEDIEDELGISLFDFFNLIKQGKFKYENEYGFIIDFNEDELKSAIKEILTKEELEK